MATAVSAGTKIRGSTVRLTRDDITLLDVDAFVYYASHDLMLGAGHGTAIATRAGASVQREVKELAPLETCDVVVSEAGKLPATHIIHAVGPRFKEPDIEAKLRRTMANVLDEAERLGARTLAFPLMGAGYYGIPPALSARVMLESLAAHAYMAVGLEEVTVCVLDANQYQAVEAAMDAMSGGGTP